MQALQRLERRTAEVLYQRRAWYKWVRNQQKEEEAQQESEKKRIRHEAALFKRHWAQVRQHIKEMRLREDLKRQEDYLEEAFQARISLEEDNAWDPIEDIVDDEHGSYVDMIRLFLFMKDEALHAANLDIKEVSTGKSSKKKSKGQKGGTAEETAVKSGMETKSQMRDRLQQGTKYVHGHGVLLKGTIENPIEVADRSAPLPQDEINQLLEEITEIKHLLFCRLILSHASLLPAALRANSVEEFLADGEINGADLRAICLKMENPEWQEVRDACADLVRGDEENTEEMSGPKEQEPARDAKQARAPTHVPNWRSKTRVPQVWPSMQDQRLRKRRQRHQSILEKSTGGAEGRPIDFGIIEDGSEQRGKKVRIRLCGRSIYNYPSERAMNRGGWLHFSIIAKDSSLSDAVKLCRHWDEFFELCILTVFQFFPAGSWMEWMGDRLNQQLIQLVSPPLS
jgi:hypothetical protein